MLEMVIVSEQ